VTVRYAIYFSPEAGSPLARLGAAWLGRDCATGADLPQPAVTGFSLARIAEITASARHYGFHATLKPPFALADGRTAEELDRLLDDFAGRRAPIHGLRLAVGVLDGFAALMPTRESAELQRLAADCVRIFDSFRLPPTEEDLRQRRSAGLSAIQESLLRRWGYPYVMEAFRFHMTLTGRLPQEDLETLVPTLRRRFDPASESVAIDAIGLFRQESRDRPFRLVRRYPLSGNARSATTKESTERSSGPSLTMVRTSLPST
jgi:putative phosphonate metabolism protein